ncbi:hypothetical protein SOVF_072220 [Spinacia oleracea]|uniref:E3 ubiquitin-protein ligase CHIP n=1 Tax=Spinacia oleracea TaxID=3562 RepID=A0A9R0KAL6_SPIOL|nr:E3 ubiquitin-protein ligase CHIP [Spinacia oleracea]KNA18299.1 hypothetical protein SOVF_072220 [Spinacia oleracea]
MSPAAALSAVAKQAELLRQDGNNCFKKSRFGAAIDAYTEAIALCPNIPIYWTNRALCHMKKDNWERVEEDCRKAILLANGSVKAHYMLGLALLQRTEYKEGVKELEKALDLGRGANPKGYMVEEIWQELAKARYLLWEQESSHRSWELQTLKEACDEALKEQHIMDSSKLEGFINEADVGLMNQLKALEGVFRKAAEQDIPSEVPDYLCCRITLDIFRDPVITPSGVTYERGVLLDHLEKVGKFDPITREPLDESQLIPNFAIKEAVQAYLDDHGWAYRTD